ncbi:DotA/TraY family protein [Ralstonia pseudosolanacearum]
MKMTKTTRSLLVLMAMLLPSFAFAANLFDLPAGDISLKVLGAIFGGLLDTGGNDPLLGGIKAFNGGCLIIGGILAGYTILAGTLNTAHDGEMLGKKFSSVWIPIRYSVGTALVLPVVGGGYCVMQALVMWLVVQGIGLADTVWSGFMSNPTAAANTTVQTNRNDMIDIAKAAFDNSMCYRSYARAISDSSPILKWGQYNYSMSQTSQGWIYGDSTSSVRRNGCGQINYPNDKNVAQADTTVVNNTPSTNSGYLGDIGTIFAPMDVSAIQQAHNTQLDALVKSMDTLAANVIATAKDGAGVSLTPDQAAADYAQIEQAADNYLNGVKSTANGLSTTDAYSKIQQTASNQGWILAGAWFTRIVQMNDRINKAVHSTPTNTGPLIGPAMDKLIFGDAAKYRDGADAVLAADPRGGYFARLKDATSSKDSEESTSGSSFTGNPIKWLEAKITEGLTGVNLYELKNDSRHPLIIANELGNRLLMASTTMIGVLAVGVAAVAKFANIGSDMIDPALQIIGWLVDLPIKLLFGVGMGTTYILPNMPFIIWIGCIVGWVLLVIEAIIAAPLWAIMHLHPNGDDLTGRGGNGYTLVLSLLLRPVLMVFGMEAAIVISSVIGEFINKTFFEVFAQSTGTFTGISAIVALAMGTMVYFIVMFIFLKKCFGIIHQLPDQLLQWIGGGGSQLGQFASEFAGATDRAGSAGAGAAGWMAGGALTSNKHFGGVLQNKRDTLKRDQQSSIKSNDAKMDQELGEGTSNASNSFSSMRHDGSYKSMVRAAQNKSAYTDAIRGVAGTDPEFGKQDFTERFAQSEADHHSAFGGDAAVAAQSIGDDLMRRNIENNSNGDFLSKAVGTEGGPINGDKMASVAGTLGKWESKIGHTATRSILDKAIGTGATGNALLRQAKDMYNKEFGGTKDNDTPPPPPSGGMGGESQG